MAALMPMLVERGFEFTVIDNRGGSGAWEVRVVVELPATHLPNFVVWDTQTKK